MQQIRILVVEDSPTIRRHMVAVLRGDPELEVVGEAEDGRRAIEMCRALRPDIVTLDMVLPGLTGLDATEHIMAHFPTPILIVSSSLNRGELFKTYEALAAGAVEVLEKPRGTEREGEWEARLIATVKLVSRIKVITHIRRRMAEETLQRAPPTFASLPLGAQSRLVGIGTSTGGPGAVMHILRALPAPFTLPILLVLHLGDPFGAPLAEWLDSQSRHPVAQARDGQLLSDLVGRVTMAPPNRHLIVRGNRIALTDDPPRHSCRPSVDVLFESMARELGPSGIACLLTGMGRDGAEGLLQIRRAGGVTIAQDEASSIVYGMPREAVELGAAEHVLSLDEMAPALAPLAQARTPRFK